MFKETVYLVLNDIFTEPYDRYKKKSFYLTNKCHMLYIQQYILNYIVNYMQNTHSCKNMGKKCNFNVVYTYIW